VFVAGPNILDTLPKSYESELVEDMLSLMSSFSARIYGKRSAENRKKLKQAAQKTESKIG
jgi:predicted site-specific integrase-resolvase